VNLSLSLRGNMSLRRPTTTSFDPATLFAGAVQGGWYDPSDLSTMFQDTAATTPVTAAGQSVARINDKSGNGNHLTQATAANQPTLQQDAGGRYYLDFDGTNDFMDSAGPATMAQANVVAGAVWFDGLSAQHVFDGIGAAARNAILIDAAGNPLLYAGAGPFAGGAALAINTPYVIEGEFNGASSVMRINGTAGSTVNAGAQGLDRFRVGAFASGTAHLNGRVYSLIVRDTAFSASERSNVQNHQKTKSGASF
jgi:hypothetical protein